MHFPYRLPLVIGLLAGLALVAAGPLWLTPGLPNSDDSLTHVFHLYELDQQIQSGVWPPLRFPHRGLGYGYAVLAYYPPLPYVLLESIHLAGAGYLLSFKLGLTLLTVLAGWTSYALGRMLFGAWAGLVTAFLYLFSPYLLANLHVRGALAEQLGLAVGPLVFVAITAVIRKPGWRTGLAASLIVTVMLLAHFISTLLYLPFALLYGGWLLVQPGVQARGKSLALLIAAGVTGALLSAFYWLPAVLEPAGRKAVDSTAALADYLAELFPLAALLRPAPLITYANIHGMPEIGLPALALIGVAILWLGLRWRWLPQLAQRQAGFWGVALLLTVVAMTTLAAPFWARIPAVGLLQFPFRWLGPAWLMMALLVSAAAAIDKQGWLRRGRVGMAVGILLLLWYAVAGLRNLPLDPAMLRSLAVTQVTETEINLTGLAAFEYDQADSLRDGCWVWAYEYIPRTSGLSACEAMRDLILNGMPMQSGLPPVVAQITPNQLTTEQVQANVSSPEPWILSLHGFWLPGWQAMVDDYPIATVPVGPLGLSGLEIPAGDHTVTLAYRPTPLRRMMLLMSAGLFLLWFGLALWRFRRLALGGLLGLALLFGPAAWVAARAPDPPPWHRVQVEFGGAVSLTGYTLQVTQHELALELAWLARQETDDSYKVFVHVLDDTGQLWAQADSRPVHYLSNTNRWLPGQLVLDSYRLSLPVAMPPGRYQVRVGLYNERDGVRLPVINDQGAVVDDQWLLDYAEVP